jgi:hypothetical protein
MGATAADACTERAGAPNERVALAAQNAPSTPRAAEITDAANMAADDTAGEIATGETPNAEPTFVSPASDVLVAGVGFEPTTFGL